MAGRTAGSLEVHVATSDGESDSVGIVLGRLGVRPASLRPEGARSESALVRLLRLVEEVGPDPDEVVVVCDADRLAAAAEPHRQLMVDGLPCDGDLADRMAGVFREDPLVAMAGHELLYKCADTFAGHHRPLMQELGARLSGGPPSLERGFFETAVFWSRAASLLSLADRLEAIAVQATGTSGRARPWDPLDGAIRRVWLALVPSPSVHVALLRRLPDGPGCSVRTLNAEPAGTEPERRIPLDVTLQRAPEIPADHAVVAGSSLFDDGSYADAGGCSLAGIPPLEHFLAFGEVLGLNPSAEFSTAFYRYHYLGGSLRQNTLAHFATTGLQKGHVGRPRDPDWLAAGERSLLAEPDWYARRFPDALMSADGPRGHLLRRGLRWPRPISSSFDPRTMPVLARAPTSAPVAPRPEAFLVEFMRDHLVDHDARLDRIGRMVEDDDLEGAERETDGCAQLYGWTSTLRSVRALCLLRRGQWEEAFALLVECWTLDGRHERPRRHPFLVRDSCSANDLFVEAIAGDRPVFRHGEAPRVCVYTAVFGDVDDLPPVQSPVEGVDYICFTDSVKDSAGWEIRIRPRSADDSNMSAKIFKVKPHEELSIYEYSLYVDGNTFFTGRLGSLIEQHLLGEDFVMFRHPGRSDLYRELVAIVEQRRHPPEPVFDQLRAYCREGLPANSGLAEGSFIWRRHGSPQVRAFGEAWWDEIVRWSKRDQLSLGYLMWKRDFRPKVVPAALGTSKRNHFFVKLRHGVPSSPRPACRAAPLVLVVSKGVGESSSDRVRGRELAALAADMLAERSVTCSQSLLWSGRILFLTRDVLRAVPAEELAALKERGNLLIADFLDDEPDPAKVEHADVLAAASLGAYVHYRRTWPDTPAFHVTHHVGSQTPPRGPQAVFSAGYAGDPNEAVLPDRVREALVVEAANAASPRFSLHYAVRPREARRRFAPFLDGFEAAHAGANIVVDAGANDAVEYLGPYYPFLLPALPADEEIRAMIDRARAAFGTPLWREGLDVMREVSERSSLSQVKAEFGAMMRRL